MTAASSYWKALHWLEKRPDFELKPAIDQNLADLALDRPRALNEALGRPDGAYRIILVAGTKGKGSTATLLASVLQAHGLRVGLYTQPHLHTFRERLRINGQLIEPGELAAQIDRLRPLIEKLDSQRADLGPLTTYEITTVLGLLWFAERQVDWAVLEVGLGGRLDATNIVTPAVSVITPISYDHTHLLGKTLPEIAREKAGIIKPGGVVVTGPQRPAAMRAIEAVARDQKAHLRGVDSDPGAPQGERWYWPLKIPANARQMPTEPMLRIRLKSERRDYGTLSLRLGGLFQVWNTLTTVTALEALEDRGFQLRLKALEDGLLAASWPGRLELISTRPVLVLDGAHNAASADSLADSLYMHFDFHRLHLIVGAFADKDIGGILRAFRDTPALVSAVQADSPRSLHPDPIMRLARKQGLCARFGGPVARTVNSALERAYAMDVICVTGSLAVVAEAREALGLAVREQP